MKILWFIAGALAVAVIYYHGKNVGRQEAIDKLTGAK